MAIRRLPQQLRLLLAFTACIAALPPPEAFASAKCPESLLVNLSLAKGYPTILPSVAGARDNIPRSLPAAPENRILFGIESEYGVEDAQKAVGGSSRGLQNLMRFYEAPAKIQKWKELPSFLMAQEHLDRVDPTQRPDLNLSPQELELLRYLPAQTKKEGGKHLTHEISTDILPNFDTYKKVLDGVNSHVGTGSFQSMVSIPRAAMTHMGKAETEGLVYLSNELSAFSAIANPRSNHAFLHPYNSPIGNREELDLGGIPAPPTLRGQILGQQIGKFFDEPHVASAPPGLQMNNPKYTLGLAPRFDLSDRVEGKGRFFYEIRGCKENVTCVEKLTRIVTDIYQNERKGFAPFAKLGELYSSGQAPWKFCEAWTKLPPKRQQQILADLNYKFGDYYKSESGSVWPNFLYPLKAWDSIAPSLGLSETEVRRLAVAQKNYLSELSGAEYEHLNEQDTLSRLTRAMQTFANESGLYEKLKSRWKGITHSDWDIQS
jgi:hypothetical protein